MTTGSTQYLRRLLAIIPQLADGKAHLRDDIAARNGITDPAQLIADLKSLADSCDTWNGRGGFSESIQVFIGDKHISLFANQFLRPMRLSEREASALNLGLAMLRAERAPDQQAVVEATRKHLATMTANVDNTSDRPVQSLKEAALQSHGDTRALGLLRKAHKRGQKAQIRYRGGSQRESTDRIIHPYGFVFANGMWYVVGHCERNDGVRYFRLDRIEHAEMTGDAFTIPQSFNLDAVTASRPVLDGQPVTHMRVRYSPAVARWIAEREGLSLDNDGSLVREHPVHDIGWAIRHVLQYGPEAEILHPPTLRAEVAARLQSMQTLPS